MLIFQICVSSEAKYIHIKEQDCTKGSFDPELANQVLVFVGLNNKDTETVLKEDSPLRAKYEYKVKKIYKPKGWKGKNFTHCVFGIKLPEL